MVLRGVFLCRQREVDWFYRGPGVNNLFPEEWAAFESLVPEAERDDLLGAYGRRLRGEKGQTGEENGYCDGGMVRDEYVVRNACGCSGSLDIRQ